MFKPNDIVKVIHYESTFAGLLGEIREITGDSAYVEFNDANGDSQDGQILSLSWLEWIYSPNGWKVPARDRLNIEAIDHLNQLHEMDQIDNVAYLRLHDLISGAANDEF